MAGGPRGLGRRCAMGGMGDGTGRDRPESDCNGSRARRPRVESGRGAEKSRQSRHLTCAWPGSTGFPSASIQKCTGSAVAPHAACTARPSFVARPSIVVTSTPGFSDEVIHAFIATPLVAAPVSVQDPDEVIDLVEMPSAELLEACRTGEIRDAKTLATILLAQLNGWIRCQ